jgi:diaminopimelate epimerase
MSSLTVTKCHGTGNDFVLLDARGQSGLQYAVLARELCQRRFSIGADGLLVLEQTGSPAGRLRMRIFNADGSEAQMCGNGIRCVARYLHEEDPSRTSFDILTAAGTMHVQIVDWHGEPGARVAMGVPVVNAVRMVEDGSLGQLSVHEIDMGNPHAVVFVQNGLAWLDLARLAHVVTNGNPDRMNVEVVIAGPHEAEMRVLERGVGETWACGTGACAVAVAAINAGNAHTPVTVRSRGGAVEVAWAGPGKPAYLTGDAHLVFRTTLPAPLAASLAGS